MISIPSRFQGIEIPENEPFKYDKLGYAQYASILKGIVDMYQSTGCVLAVNGKWGTGKTTFMQMWRAFLPKDKYSTVYFNAWETDYFSDPLIAILGELKEISLDSESFKKICSSLGSIALAASGAALKEYLKNRWGIDPEAIKDSIDSVKNVFQDSLEDYSKQKLSLVEFKQKLSEYVAGQDGNPVVFIIDELDRCNPHYAVRVLEIVKHFFDVPNICFVLAIDKTQFECSIKGFYGSNEIDAANYLRRFIDIEFNLPKPDINGFTEMLLGHYNYQEYFSNLHDSQNANIFYERLCSLSVSLFDGFNLDLRTYDKVLSHTRLALMQLGDNAFMIEPVLFLCFCHIVLPAFFVKLQDHDSSAQELINDIENVFPRSLLNIENSYNVYSAQSPGYVLTNVIGPLLYMYDSGSMHLSDGVFVGVTEKTDLQLECKIINKTELRDSIVWCQRVMGVLLPTFDNIINKVALLQQFK